MDRPSPEIVNCTDCGARNFAIDDTCALCGASLVVYTGPPPKIRHVSLGSVMIVIGVVAVCLAPVRVAPGVSLLLSMILIPATTRTILHIEGRKVEGRPMSYQDKLDTMVKSSAIAFTLLFASSIAFFVTCLPIGCLFINRVNLRTGAVPPGFYVAYLAGFIGAAFVLYRLGRFLWPRRD